MNGLNRTNEPGVADYMSEAQRLRAREGMRLAMNMGNATLRVVARLRLALSALTKTLSRDHAPRRILAKTGVTYFD